MGFPSVITREAGTSPTRRRSGRRLSGSHIVIGVLALLAFALNYLALQDRDATVLVAVADQPLAAGSLLVLDDLRLVPVASDFAGVDSMLTEAELVSRDGWVLDRPVAADGVIEEGMLVEPGAPSGLRAMSIPVDIEHAVGGGLGPGDRIDIISTADDESIFVVTDVAVLSVADRSAAVLGGIGAFHIVVAVDAEQALSLAGAIADGEFEVVRSTGARPVEESEGA
ncbi:MAG: RcpC/CpaB family pilus assembly protein [Acidimicrobiia bacterium]